MIVKFSIYEELDSVEDLEKDLIKVSGKIARPTLSGWIMNERWFAASRIGDEQGIGGTYASGSYDINLFQ